MSVREAKFVDVPTLVMLILEAHERSKYAEMCRVDAGEARQLFMSALQRTTVKGPSGSCVFVSENGEKIDGLILGVLEPIYHVGDKFMATDLFFYVAEKAGHSAFARLLSAFETWARANPKVIEIKLGVTDVLGDTTPVERFYERRGYQRCGAMFVSHFNTEAQP